jgi:hypothetical protein
MEADQGPIRTESYRTRGEHLLGRVKELVREGNVRRIIIKNEEGRTLLEVPLTIGVVGAALAPALAAIGAIAALLTHCTLEVQRDASAAVDEPSAAEPDADPTGPVL